jgi:hypothetical protein
MIELKQVKVFPLHNPNIIISNKSELFDMVQSVPIVEYFDYDNKNWFEQARIIGMVAPNGSINVEDDCIVSDIYLYDETFKDYLFKNYEVNVDEISKKDRIFKIKKINAIEFGRIE